MNPRGLCFRTLVVVIVAGVMAAIAAIGYSSATAATTQPQPCPPAQQAATCIKGQVIIWEDPANPALNQLVQEDNSGAPQFSVGVGGLTSWANPLCISNNPLTDKGRLMCPVLIGGAWGNGQGRPVITVTGNDGVMPVIVLVQDGRRAVLDYRRLAWLDRWLAARGVR